MRRVKQEVLEEMRQSLLALSYIKSLYTHTHTHTHTAAGAHACCGLYCSPFEVLFLALLMVAIVLPR